MEIIHIRILNINFVINNKKRKYSHQNLNLVILYQLKFESSNYVIFWVNYSIVLSKVVFSCDQQNKRLLNIVIYK